MPRLSRWYIRAGLVHFLLGFTVGALMLANKGVPFYPAAWRWLPVHIELLFMGWVVELTLGVAFWIMPRFWRKPRRGNETGAWLAFLFLNVGIWMVVAGSLWPLTSWGKTAVFGGRLLEAAAAVAFAVHIWQRIVPRNFIPPAHKQ
ncbi:MAG: hypothetical protein D6706_02415 [Chloroflexi bacterium]|nr:MAG: hypothetical protein D6706_02415 [Chloroflexota bacterium]